MIVDDFELRSRQIIAPVNQIGVHDIHSVVFELAIEARHFKYLAKDADGVNEVGE